MNVFKKQWIFLCLLVPAFIWWLNKSSALVSSHFKAPPIMDASNVKNEQSISVTKVVSTVAKQEQKKRRRPMVVVLAYMHTGSTFLGSILQQHRGAFYEYENLRSLMYSTRAGKVINFLNDTKRKLTPHPDTTNVHHNVDPQIGAEAVRNMVTCHHDKLDVATLANHYFPISSPVNKHLRDYFSCQERAFGSSTALHARDALHYVQNKMLYSMNRTQTILKKCLPILIQRCQNASLSAEKFIRMTMKMAEILLKDLPDVKIIHLVRDPRAMLDSQARKGDSGANKPEVLKTRIKYMCHQMISDLKLAKELKNIHPNSIYTIRYEDLVKTTIPVIENMFNFIDVPLTTEDRNFVIKNSKSSHKPIPNVNQTVVVKSKVRRSGNFKSRTLKSLSPPKINNLTNRISKVRSKNKRITPVRKTSAKITKSWREHLSADMLNVLNTHCSEIYELLGYVKFTNRADLLDSRNEHFVPISLN